MNKLFIWRWIFFVGGLMVMSFGIAMTIKGSLLGIGPWDVLHVGLYQNFGLTIGTWGIITGLLIVLTTALSLRQWPQLGTWLNMILIGLFIDLFNWLLPDVQAMWGQTLLFIVGVLIMGYGIGLYISPNVGAGPRDSLMLLLVDRLGVSIKTIRTAIEVIVALIGWLLGGPVGIGTVIIAVCIGQIVQYSLPHARKLLLKLANETDEDVLLQNSRALKQGSVKAHCSK